MKQHNNIYSHASADEYASLARLCSTFTFDALFDAVHSLAELRVLVIGDTIFDRYAYVNVLGLTSKNRIISSRFLHEETHCGGAMAVFNHVKQFSPHVKFLSLVGTEEWVEPRLRGVIAPAEDCVLREAGFATIVKQRFVEPLIDGAEMSKLFAVNFLSTDPLEASVQRRVEAAVLQEIANCDIVLLADFGHGLMQPGVRDLVQEHGTLVAVSCQTNSYNHGFNIISRQYQRVDAFTLDERELVLSAGHPDLDFQKELGRLKQRLGARYAWLTRGALETIGFGPDDVPYCCPPLERNVVDTIGAGDAFFAVAALAAARGLPIELATFLSQLAGAQAVRVVGNSRPLSKDGLLQTARYLLNATHHADMRWANSP